MDYQKIVESAGGMFLEVRDGFVLFRDGANGPTLRLYASACRRVTDVVLAIKASREEIRSNLNIWERADEVLAPKV
jgi:hypothetical protein